LISPNHRTQRKKEDQTRLIYFFVCLPKSFLPSYLSWLCQFRTSLIEHGKQASIRSWKGKKKNLFEVLLKKKVNIRLDCGKLFLFITFCSSLKNVTKLWKWFLNLKCNSVRLFIFRELQNIDWQKQQLSKIPNSLILTKKNQQPKNIKSKP
jgi:hypothetical protein